MCSSVSRMEAPESERNTHENEVDQNDESAGDNVLCVCLLSLIIMCLCNLYVTLKLCALCVQV